MDKMMAALRNEWDLIWLKPKSYIFLALTAVFPLLIGWMLLRLNASVGILPILPSQLPQASLSFLTNLFLPLLLFMLVAENLSYKPQQLKAFFLRPVHRYKLYISKIAAIGGTLALHLLVGYISALLAGLLLQGGSGPWLSQLAAYGASLLPLLLWVAISSLVAQFFKSSSLVLAFMILLYGAAAVLAFLYPHSLAALMPTQYHTWYETGTTDWSVQLFSLLYLIAGTVLFFLLGVGKFERRSI